MRFLRRLWRSRRARSAVVRIREAGWVDSQQIQAVEPNKAVQGYMTLGRALRVYVDTIRQHAEAFPADDEEGFDEDLAQVVSSLGFLGTLDPGCLDPEEDELAAAMLVLRQHIKERAA